MAKDPKRPSEDSLIPSRVLDHASQRLFLVSLFILVQGWKIYDIILVRTDSLSSSNISLTGLNNFTFVLKYAAIDGLFLWILPVLNVPYLSFSPLATVLLTLLVNAFTFVLASNVMIPIFANIILPVWKVVFNKKELTIIGDSVKLSNIIDMNSHFKGKYTIQYLPDSSAKFNPFHYDKLCLTSEGIRMPIEFNTTTDLGFLQIQRISPENEVSILNYTKSDLDKLLRKDYSYLRSNPDYVDYDARVFYAEILLSKPGKYRINKVTDKKGISIRTYKSEFLVGECPNAEFTYPVPKSSHLCVGKDQDYSHLVLPLVQVLGVPPLVVEFSASLNGRKVHSFNQTLLSDVDSARAQSDLISRNLLEQELLRYPELISSSAAGTLEFSLAQVTDYFGNSRKYNPQSKDQDVWTSIELKRIGQISLSDNSLPLLVNSTKQLKVNANVPESDYPVTVEVHHESTPYTTHVFKSRGELKNGITVDKPGTYKLVSGSSHFCPCEASSSVIVDVALPPSVDIDADPLLDKCVGMVGYKFGFNFSGAPPFTVQYQVFRKYGDNLKPVHNEQGRMMRQFTSTGNHYNFEYRPPAEGNYYVTFKNVRDYYYKTPISLDEKHTYLTYFNKRSSVSFFEDGSNSKTLNLCYNESVSVPVYFQGNHPFSFSYSVLGVEKLVADTAIKNWTDNVFYIQTPTITKGGEYTVQLSNIMDSLGCEADFNRQEKVLIKSRTDVPQIGIFKSDLLHVVEGDAVEVPLTSKILSSDHLTYIFENSNGKLELVLSGTLFRVKDAGIYSLKSFKSGGCVGKVTNTNKVEVSYLPRPKLTVTADSKSLLKQHQDERTLHLKPDCQNCHHKIRLHLEGEKPFLVDYDVKLPSGKTDSRTLTVNANHIDLDLPTEASGRYEHQFKNVFDARYTRAKASRINYQQQLSRVLYDVRPAPSVAFTRASSMVQVCVTNLLQQQAIPDIPLSLTGEYPFTISGSFKQGLEGKTHRFQVVVNEPVLSLTSSSLPLLKKNVPKGEYLLTLNEVKDGNGCESKKLTQNQMVVAVTEAPNIYKLSCKPHYCVGDRILYNMTGVAPYTVFYNFNGKDQKAETSSKFSRLASRPGHLSITALQDSSANQCTANFTSDSKKTEQLLITVHDLPSVEISQGEDIITNIHEGDQTEITFKFTGVPPFYLKYVRELEEIDLKYRKNRKQVRKVREVKEVDGIKGFEYTVTASLEGTYEAIEVRDAFCTAKRQE